MSKSFFLFINFLVSVVIGIFYILIANLEGIFPYISLIANTFLIYILISIPVYLLSFLPELIFSIFLAIIFTILHSINLVDVIIFYFFKYHINGMVLNVLTTPNGIKALDIPMCDFIYFAIFVALTLVIELLILYFIKIKKTEINLKPVIIFLFLILTVEKGIYIYKDLNCSEIVKKIKLTLPLYQPLTCKKFFKKVLHVKLKKCKKFNLSKNIHLHKNLHYPLHKIKLSKLSSYPNIIFILLDAWRADKFNKNYTPNIYNFSKNSLIFKNHKSGGIATRFGVFTLFYGIYGIYWHKFLSEHVPPVFLNVLQKLNYDFKILTSTSLKYPEFTQTIFLKLQNKIEDNPPGKYIYEKDRNITENFISWINTMKNEKRPFFSFIFLDGPHAKSFAPNFNKFKLNKNINYFIVGKKNITFLKQAYLNAIYYDDYLVGKILTVLKSKGLLKNSIILISADHGEEFFEHGHLGHTSAFTPEQNNVPLILYIPNKKHKIFQKLTCHYDIVPTILKILGVKNQESDYSNGINLLGSKKHKYIIAASWTNFAIIYPDYRFIFSMATYKMGLSEIRDNNFKLIKNNTLIKHHIKDFSNILKDFARF